MVAIMSKSTKQQKADTVSIRLRLAELVGLAGSEVEAARILRDATGCDMTHDAITRMLR